MALAGGAGGGRGAGRGRRAGAGAPEPRVPGAVGGGARRAATRAAGRRAVAHGRAGRAGALDVSDRVAGRRGIVVAGADAPDPRRARHRRGAGLARPRRRAVGMPLPARTTVGAFDALLRAPAFAAAHRPEVVLRLGAPLTSRVLNEWLAAPGADQVLVHPRHAWLDPDRTAATVLRR